jgi:hypothetical protein
VRGQVFRDAHPVRFVGAEPVEQQQPVTGAADQVLDVIAADFDARAPKSRGV